VEVLAHSRAADRDSGEILLDEVFAQAEADLVEHAATPAGQPGWWRGGWCPICEEPRPCSRYGTALMLLDHPRARHPQG